MLGSILADMLGGSGGCARVISGSHKFLMMYWHLQTSVREDSAMYMRVLANGYHGSSLCPNCRLLVWYYICT